MSGRWMVMETTKNFWYKDAGHALTAVVTVVKIEEVVDNTELSV